LIEFPPYGNEVEASALNGITLTHKQLSDDREWFVESPVGLLIVEGVVFDIHQAGWFAGEAASNARRRASTSAGTREMAVALHGNS
jgi:hypothetical protein